ncbi:MAG TPA: hypothetical protein P5217_01660 [Methanoregulaceae archaeon]|nr:hypothetical protein [Methanoregulaceae archaeon]HRY74967.1 hypothetical protein [Methanoregulaceae archaeon]
MNWIPARYVPTLIFLSALLVIPASGAVSAGDSAPAFSPSPSALSPGTLFPVHAILMTLGFLFFLAGALFPALRKGRHGWLFHHQILASAGTILSLFAFAAAYLMVGSFGGPHVRVPHAFLGILVIALIVATFLLGFFRTRLKPYTLQAIAAHRWMGRVLLLLMALTIVSGLFTAGLIG